MRLFFDANTLFTAAHNPHGKAALVIELGSRGHWELFTSSYATEEARRNLAVKSPDALPAFLQLLAVFQTARADRPIPCPDSLPEKDRPIYLAAHGCRASHLLTGDIKDFGPLMNRPEKTGGLIIQTVAQFLSSL